MINLNELANLEGFEGHLALLQEGVENPPINEIGVLDFKYPDLNSIDASLGKKPGPI